MLPIDEAPSAAPGSPELPERIGRYHIVRELGRGGMGIVYLGEREEDFSQRVAIKLVQQGAANDGLNERFDHERQILASLQHANIARFLDADSTRDGVPYFVMEYVDGTPIDRYCSERSLSIRERLALFLPVCNAVQAAHQRLVVHRDLKPSNILVTAGGTPKLLDFGIARIVDDPSGGTLTDLRAWTPDYASPEQIEGRALTTATDVYSLGVILYELLTGTRPYHFESRTPIEIGRVVAESHAPLPSTKAPDRQAARALRGDLDTIVAKAMHKDPQRRYASVEALAADIRRHLDGLPVRARRDSLAYRAGKFVRRYRAASIAALLLLLALIAGIAATAWQAREARLAQQRAERRFSELRTLARTLIFDLDPEIAVLAGSTSAREQIVRTGLKYLDSLATEADDATLQIELAQSYLHIAEVQGNPYASNLGQSAEGQKSYQKAIAILERVLAKRPDDLDASDTLARCYTGLADIAGETDDIRTVERYYRRSAEILEANLRRETTLDRRRAHAFALVKHADVLGHGGVANLGRIAESKQEHARVLALRESMARDYPADERVLTDLVESLNKIAFTLNGEGKYDEAAAMNDRALRIMSEISARNPTSTTLQRDLSLAYLIASLPLRDAGRYEQALPYVRKSLEIMTRLAEQDASSALWQRNLSVIGNHLSATLTGSGAFEEAAAASRRAVTIAESLWRSQEGPESGLDLIIAHRRATEPLLELRDAAAVTRHANDGLAILGKIPTEENARAAYERALLRNRLGRALALQNDHTAALREFEPAREALASQLTSSPDDIQLKDELANTLYHLARSYESRGDDRARATMAESARLWDELRHTGKLPTRSADEARLASARAATVARR